MKLATTTSDYQAYTHNQDYAISMIKDAGFKYIDYSFIMDYKNGSGIFGNDPDGYIDDIKRLAEKLEVKFVQSHSPMGTPIVKDGNYRTFIDATNKCIKACSKLGIDNIVVHSGMKGIFQKMKIFTAIKSFIINFFLWRKNMV